MLGLLFFDKITTSLTKTGMSEQVPRDTHLKTFYSTQNHLKSVSLLDIKVVLLIYQ